MDLPCRLVGLMGSSATPAQTDEFQNPDRSLHVCVSTHGSVWDTDTAASKSLPSGHTKKRASASGSPHKSAHEAGNHLLPPTDEHVTPAPTSVLVRD